MIRCPHPCYHLKSMGYILKNVQKISVSVLRRIYDKLKNRSHIDMDRNIEVSQYDDAYMH